MSVCGASPAACAGTGLGATDSVAAGQGVAQHARLDRRAVRETEVLDGMHQLGGELEIVKADFAFLWLDGEVFEFPGSDRWFWGRLTP